MSPPSRPMKAKARSRTSAPSEVAPGIFVGGWKDAEGFSGTRICVLDERPEELDRMAGATHVPIYDGAKDAPIVANLDRVASEMNAAHRGHDPVLVFCGHGIRRSPLAAAWYLHRYEKLSLDDAYARIRALRPKVETPREWIGNWKKLEG